MTVPSTRRPERPRGPVALASAVYTSQDEGTGSRRQVKLAASWSSVRDAHQRGLRRLVLSNTVSAADEAASRCRAAPPRPHCRYNRGPPPAVGITPAPEPPGIEYRLTPGAVDGRRSKPSQRYARGATQLFRRQAWA